MSKHKPELYEIADEMISHMGESNFLHEVLTGMSSQELQDTLEHIDRVCFSNHFFVGPEEEDGEDDSDGENEGERLN
jgi:hypothetical protein